MELESRLLDLLVEWNEAVLVKKSVSVEALAPNDPELQRLLRDAIARQQSERAIAETTSTGLFIPTEDDERLPPLSFPGFRVTGEIGRGGMGIVFEAIDERLGRKVAIKTIRPEYAIREEVRLRFRQEARAAASIQSDHVVTIHQVEDAHGIPFMAMEYLRGQPLSSWMKEHRATLSNICRIGYEIAMGLAAAHESGHVHRDIKPANIWLEAPAGRVKILDFGLARTIEADLRLTRSDVILGTPAYMSPEQGRNEQTDHRSDLFSLGAVLYQLATGRRPFQGHDVFEVLVNLVTQTPPPAIELNPAIGLDLSDLIGRLLSKDPAGRPQSAREVAVELRRIHKGKPKQPKAVLVEYTPQPILLPPKPQAPAIPTPAAAPPQAWTNIELDALPESPRNPVRAQSRLWVRVLTITWALLIIAVCAAALLKMLKSLPGSRPRSAVETERFA